MPSAYSLGRLPPAPLPPAREEIATGNILSFNQAKGWGFIKSDFVSKGDVFFQRGELPLHAQGSGAGQLLDLPVRFVLLYTPDGKARARQVEFLAPLKSAAPPTKLPAAPAAPLDDDRIADMERCLEENGGSMDYGAFAREFRGVKKSQLEGLEDRLVLRRLEDDVGGRWVITLPGVEPDEATLPPRRVQEKPAGMEPLVPADGGRFAGLIHHFDAAKGYGFIKCGEVTQGDVYFKKSDLSPDLQSKPRGGLINLEVELDVMLTSEGKPRGENVEAVPGGGAARGKEEAKDKPPPPPLEDDKVDEMIRSLEEVGGFMDFGKFCGRFPGVKKVQVEPHFQLKSIGNVAQGRWAIALEGVDVPDTLPGRGAEERPGAGGTGRELTPLVPASGDKFVGTINNFNGEKGYGFVVCDEVKGDIYFKKTDMAPELHSRPRQVLVGLKVTLNVVRNPDGKPRGLEVEALEEVGGKGDEEAKTPAELDQDMLDDMTAFLEEVGGHIDYGKFAAKFTGVKKVQIKPHFQLVQIESNAGGRWTIALEGVSVPDELPEEAKDAGAAIEALRRGREAGEGERERKPKVARKGQPPGGAIEPSPTLWLIGCVKKWDEKKGYGFLVADGADNVFIHRNDLPPEMPWRSSAGIVGSEVAFELVMENGKLRAKTVRALIGPNGFGGWVLRRA